eukprot:764641-Hanusia_phi.AAC.1
MQWDKLSGDSRLDDEWAGDRVAVSAMEKSRERCRGGGGEKEKEEKDVDVFVTAEEPWTEGNFSHKYC